MIPCYDDVRHITEECLAPFHWNRRKQRHHECSSKANRQLVKRNSPSSSCGTDLRISSRNTFTRNGKYDMAKGLHSLKFTSALWPKGTRGNVAECLTCQAPILHCHGSTPTGGVDNTDARSKLQSTGAWIRATFG
ncbi:unnamed protein product [Protopolystoma xenopodis]|uniref:Uncharacterized protein n=1 Tax=Protopolystoma xenopodis TaxID=117903 RepID=A0A3S5AWT2_9PLAT|nr:unnamed protein product [Protopolystoma xenopodis]